MSTCSSCPRSARSCAGVGRELELQHVVLAQRAAEHLLHVADHGVDLEHLRLEELLAGEGEELAGDVGGAGAGLDDLLDVGAAGVALLQAPEQELAEADDAGHHVVDLVRHAARELAGGLHPLRAAQLLLHPLPLGDVAVDAPDHRPAARP